MMQTECLGSQIICIVEKNHFLHNFLYFVISTISEQPGDLTTRYCIVDILRLYRICLLDKKAVRCIWYDANRGSWVPNHLLCWKDSLLKYFFLFILLQIFLGQDPSGKLHRRGPNAWANQRLGAAMPRVCNIY